MLIYVGLNLDLRRVCLGLRMVTETLGYHQARPQFGSTLAVLQRPGTYLRGCYFSEGLGARHVPGWNEGQQPGISRDAHGSYSGGF